MVFLATRFYVSTPPGVIARLFGLHQKAQPSARRMYGTAFPYGQFPRQVCTPHIYDNFICNWRNVKPLEDPLEELERDQSLKIVSWNVDFSSPRPSSRITTLLDHIKDVSGDEGKPLVILLQELCHDSLGQLLTTDWVSRNFNVIGLPIPMILENGMKRPARYFNLILASRTLAIKNFCRLGLPSEMGRDAIFVDIFIKSVKSMAGDRAEVIRLCTTHLESLGSGTELRKKQLQLISEHLQDSGEDKIITCGVIGGDFNSIEDQDDSELTKLGLTDAWTGYPEPSSDDLQTNDSSGRKEGHTWGYQPPETFPPRRFDKFLYTGSIEVIPTCGADRRRERVQRLGINLKTDTAIDGDGDQSDETKGGIWVSDHFGITMEVRIP